jgi:hypothetical protein
MFLGPLLLMHYSKKPLHQLQTAWPDGIPLDIIRSLLPRRSRIALHVYLHIHLHASVANKKTNQEKGPQKLSKHKLLNLVSSLEILVNKLKIPALQSTWSAYYDEAAQRDDYLGQKKKIINEWTDHLKNISQAADLGANKGEFSRLLAEKNIRVLSADFDPYCINSLYTTLKVSGEKNIQPLILDLSNPTPASGVNSEERSSFITRANADLVLALALVHHLAIGKNIPLAKIAAFFTAITRHLIIEFVPIEDEKVQFMLAQKADIYPDYHQAGFETAFENYFVIEKKEAIAGSGRTLYLLTKK